MQLLSVPQIVGELHQPVCCVAITIMADRLLGPVKLLHMAK